MISGFQKTTFEKVAPGVVASQSAALSQATEAPILYVVKPAKVAAPSAEQRSDLAVRRRTPRRVFRRPAGILVGGTYAVFEGRSLSEGGIGLTIGEDPRWASVLALVTVGARVVVSIMLPSGAALVLRGEVAHHGNEKTVGHAIGIKFSDIVLHQRREIRYYVSAKEAGESEV